MNCENAECRNTATFHFTRLEERRPVDMTYLCDEHARVLLRNFRSSVAVMSDAPNDASGLVRVDIEMIVHHNGCEEKPTLLYLHRTSGVGRFGIMIGEWERSALAEELTRRCAKQPTTHQAWVKTISVIGGELQDVVIDDLNDADGWLDAKLRILKDGNQLTVDVRPSDAFILAAACDVPILVDEKIFDALAKKERDGIDE